MSKVTVHSQGMISVDASSVERDRASIDLIKQTNLYRRMVAIFGQEKAARLVENGSRECQTQPPDSKQAPSK